MQNLIDHRPKTIMEVFKGLPEGTLAEVIDNALYMSPAPSLNHQEISIRLSSRIFMFLEEFDLGKVFYSPVDLYLDETSNAVQPDIVFFFHKNRLTLRESSIHGSPNLIIEILSPGNSRHDQIFKKDLYEKFGVDEYWIVDPVSNIATGYMLQRNKFVTIGEFKSHIQSALLNRRFDF